MAFRFSSSSSLQTLRLIVLTCSSSLVQRSSSESTNKPLILSNSPARYSSLCDCICAICFCIDSLSTRQLTRSCSSSKLAFLNLSVNSLLSNPALRIFYSCSFFLFIWVNCSSYSICCFSNKRASFYDNNTYSQSRRICSSFRISQPVYSYVCRVALLPYSSAALFIYVFALSSASRRNCRSSLNLSSSLLIFLRIDSNSGHSSLSSYQTFFPSVSGVLLGMAMVGDRVPACCGVTREG